MFDPDWNTRVLCVDDEPAILDYYRECLAPPSDDGAAVLDRVRARRRAESGLLANRQPVYEVITASSGEEAVDIVAHHLSEGHQIAAGFFDMKMPGGIDGLETLRRLRLLDAEMLCGVVTACTERTIEQIGACFHSPDQWLYFNKPFARQELSQLALHLVTGWNLRRSRRHLVRALTDSNHQLRAAWEQVNGQHLSTIRALVRGLEARDPLSSGHSARVSAVAELLAGRAGVPEAELAPMRPGFILHDLGKIALPDALLGLTGPLGPEQEAQLREHPRIGARILGPVEHLATAATLALQHHERWDGGGYPHGLRGEQIHLGARILAIADRWDHLTQEGDARVALAALRAEQGRALDPELTGRLLELLESQLAPDLGRMRAVG